MARSGQRDRVAPAACGRRRGMHGVTLLEILLVVALIAVVAGMAAMSMGGGLDGMRLRAATKEVAAQLRHARTQAIVTGTAQTFSIDPVRRQWQSSNGRSGAVPEALTIRFYGARELQPAAGLGGIRFFADGASSGGRIQLRAGDAGMQVEVAWLTGEVVVGPLPGERG